MDNIDTEHYKESLEGMCLEHSIHEHSGMEKDQLCLFIEKIKECFCTSLSFEQTHIRTSILFPEYNSLLTNFNTYYLLISHALEWVEEIEWVNDDESRDIISELKKAKYNVIMAKEAAIYTYHQNANICQNYKGTMEDFYTEVQDSEYKSHQKLLKYILHQCAQKNMRKKKQSSSLFAPYYCEGRFTYHYKYSQEISEFIHECLYPWSTNSQMFIWLTDRPNTFRFLVEYLTNCKDDKLPELSRVRTTFSFKNGVYDSDVDIFYPYEDDSKWPNKISDIPIDTISSHFIDSIFDYHKYAIEEQQKNDPLDIVTENCDTILKSQNFEDDVCRWSYASIGRMIFPVGSKDNWQYLPLYKGQAGTGKSSLLKIATNFFSMEDVGILMSEGQQTFSVEHLYDKYMFICYDIDKKLTLSQTRWNQMVSGETMSIERKFKQPIQIQWSATGAFAGNTYPPWPDNKGNVSRRFLIFDFDQVVNNTDPGLYDRCMNIDFPAFLKKCVSCYHYQLRLYGKRGIWDSGVLPTYFHSNKEELQNQTNPMRQFIQSDTCILGQDQNCTFQDFRANYMNFLKEIRCKDSAEYDLVFGSSKNKNLFANFNIYEFNPPSNSIPEDNWIYQQKYLTGIGINLN